MTDANEAAGGKTVWGSVLDQSLRTLSLDQEVTFDLYARLVLPLDGFVYWVKASTLSESALLNAARLNSVQLNQTTTAAVPAPQLTAKCSIHYASNSVQEEDANYTINRVVFTSLQPIQEMNSVGPELIYIASFDGIRFAFSARGSFYEQANMWHYVGNAIYSTMQSQIIDDPSTFNSRQIVVSNSLPAWLALNHYAPAYPVPLPQPKFLLFPSYLVPDNLPPIYGTVHIGEEDTTYLQSVPYLSKNYSHYQLAQDHVSITLYGVNNDLAQTFMDSVLQYSVDTNAFGIMSPMPIMRDAKKTQNELDILAMKKRITFFVSYYQTSMRNITRKLITECVPTYYPQTDPQHYIIAAPVNVST